MNNNLTLEIALLIVIELCSCDENNFENTYIFYYFDEKLFQDGTWNFNPFLPSVPFSSPWKHQEAMFFFKNPY